LYIIKYLTSKGNNNIIDIFEPVINKAKYLFKYDKLYELSFDNLLKISKIWLDKRKYSIFLFDISKFKLVNLEIFSKKLIKCSDGIFDEEFFNFIFYYDIKMYGE